VSLSDPDQLYIHSIKIKQQPHNHLSGPHNQLAGERPYKKRKLLFLGGWGAPTASYFSLFKDLSEHFEITAVDMLGMGCSGRPNYYAFDVDSSLEFFMLQLEAWLEAS
jgi:pimeloyl-ACP methyl ester carboxylesterase